MFTIKHNRTTNHIAGLTVRTTTGGEEKGGVVADYAQNACGSITRYALADGKSFETVAEALEAARKGGRKLCKTCERAALAMIEAEAAAPVEAPTENKGENTVTVTPDVKTEAFDRARALGADHAEAAEAADRAAKAAPFNYRTTHPVSGKTVRIPSDRPAKWAAWEGTKLFGLANVETEAEAVKGLPQGREIVVTEIFPISPRKAPVSGIIAPSVPVNAGTATTEKGDEMPPRKRTAAKKTTAETVADAVSTLTEEQRAEVREAVSAAPEAPADAPTDTDDAIDRVKDIIAQVLAAAEVGESADPNRIKELAEAAEAIITDLPMEHRTGLRAALNEAKRGESYTAEGHSVKAGGKKIAPSKAVAKARATVQSAQSKETQDYKTAIPEAAKVVADISASLAAGVKHEIDNATSTRAVAEKILHARLHLTDKDGHPDFHGKSHAAKQITTDVITGAGSNIERNEESEDALDRLMKSVQNLRNDVLVKYVRNITAEDAQKFFPLALKADPKAEPAAAIRKFYSIPEKSTFEIQAEKRRLERAQRKALAAGDEKRAKELTEAIKTVGKAEGEGGEGEGEGAAAAPKTAAEKRAAKHVGAIEAAGEKLAGIEADLEKISKEEAAQLAADLESLIGKTSALVAMLKQK